MSVVPAHDGLTALAWSRESSQCATARGRRCFFRAVVDTLRDASTHRAGDRIDQYGYTGDADTVSQPSSSDVRFLGMRIHIAS